MPMATPAAARTHIDAVLALLASSGVSAYRGEAPRGGATLPYVIVWPTPGRVESSNMVDAADLRVEFQTTSVGGTAEQAEWMADKVNVTLHHSQPAVAGRSGRGIFSEEAPQPVRRDDTLAEPLFYATTRWVFITTTS